MRVVARVFGFLLGGLICWYIFMPAGVLCVDGSRESYCTEVTIASQLAAVVTGSDGGMDVPPWLPWLTGLIGGLLGFFLVARLQARGRMRGTARVMGAVIVGLIALFWTSAFLYDVAPFVAGAVGLVVGYVGVRAIQRTGDRRQAVDAA